MIIKKMLLLASLALAAAALAAPAAQANQVWEEGGHHEAAGSISSSGGGLVTGPGVVDFTLSLKNSGGMASGSITAAQITGTLNTNLPDCHAFATASNLPWGITINTPNTAEITNVTFTNHYSTPSSGEPGCAAFGVPASVSAAGTVTGAVESEEGVTCISLEAAGDLKNEATGGAVTLTTVEPICINEGLE